MDAVVVIFCLVTAVQDGDSLICQSDSNRSVPVRLAGIDAPEYRQPFSRKARQALTDLTLEKEVRLECNKIDPYHRRVCKVFVQPPSCPSCGKTLDAGLTMLTLGLAWWYRYYAHEQSPQDAGAYEFAEFEARAKKAGLWRVKNPTPPWKWRQRQRK